MTRTEFEKAAREQNARRAQEVASSFGMPLMIHMGQTVSPVPKLFALLKRGDIVTHMFAPPPNSIVDGSGRVLPEVLAARRRGVWFDLGNGQNGHIRWDTVGTIMKAGFWPEGPVGDSSSSQAATNAVRSTVRAIRGKRLMS